MDRHHCAHSGPPVTAAVDHLAKRSPFGLCDAAGGQSPAAMETIARDFHVTCDAACEPLVGSFGGSPRECRQSRYAAVRQRRADPRSGS